MTSASASFVPRPEATTLVVVGIESYAAAGTAWDLPGPAADARRFADWFWAQGVPHERTLAFVSDLDEGRSWWANAPVEPLSATRENLRTAFARTVPAAQGDLLVVVWGGHGMMGVGGRRHLFTADATPGDPVNVDVDAVLALHRSPTLASFGHQIWLVDACQTLHDGVRSGIDLPREDFGVRDVAPGRTQELLLAARPEQRAANLSPERTGLFSRELLRELNGPANRWPLDVPALAQTLSARFETMRDEGLARQIPTYLWIKDRTGREGQLLAESPVTTASPSAGAVPGQKPDIQALGPVLKSLLAVPGFLSESFRDDVIAVLRASIRTTVARSRTPQHDAVSLLITCRRFPGGLPELLEAVRLFAGDGPEVQNFGAALEKWL